MSDADNLDIKKRARRRLVGAVALALLAAIVLPMMMDPEPHPSVQDIQITIPDRAAAPALKRPAAPAESVAAVPPAVSEDDDVAADGPQLVAVDPVEPPPVEKTPAAPPPAPATTARPPAVAPQAPPVRQEASPAAKPAPSRAATDADEEARVRAILLGQPVPPRGEAFVIQVGAFSDAAKAARLADELKAQGFQAFTERSGSVTRVRVGPITGRQAADSVAARLKASGHQAVLQPR